MGTFFYTLPSMNVGQSILPRNIFSTSHTATFKDVAGWFIIDGTLTRDTGQSATSGNSTSLLRAGLLLGKNASGYYQNSVIGTLYTALTNATTQTTAVVSYGAAVEVARQLLFTGATAAQFLLVGPPTAAGTVATVSTYATATTLPASNGSVGSLTIAAPLTAFAAGSILTPTGSAYLPITVLADNPFGVDVRDINGTSINQALQRYLVGADLLTAQIINMGPTDDFGITIDTSVTTWLQNKLQANGQQFTFNTNR